MPKLYTITNLTKNIKNKSNKTNLYIFIYNELVMSYKLKKSSTWTQYNTILRIKFKSKSTLPMKPTRGTKLSWVGLGWVRLVSLDLWVRCTLLSLALLFANPSPTSHESFFLFFFSFLLSSHGLKQRKAIGLALQARKIIQMGKGCLRSM